MKPLLRACALAATLALSLLGMTRHASADMSGYCHVLCRNPTTHMITTVNVLTTGSQCCSDSFNPCPAGYTAGTRSFSPLGGGLQSCPA